MNLKDLNLDKKTLVPLLAGVLVGAMVPAMALVGAPVLGNAADAMAAIAGDDDAHDGLDPASDHDSALHASDAHDHKRDRHQWQLEDGHIPTREEAESQLTEVRHAYIEADSEFNPDNGVVAGSGTADDPYILEELYVIHDLYIADTDSYFIIRNSYIAGQLTLNWVGDKVYVHHNYVRDLRVNENVARTGDATGGLLENNDIGVVGQIRHFDGVFRWNEVGPVPSGWESDLTMGAVEWPWKDTEALNVDGFQGADMYENVINGYVDIKLHGHHHASCYDCHAHNHGNDQLAQGHDHSVRYHWIDFHDNTIQVEEPGLALRYTDTNHAGDDRSARSEDTDMVETDHVHYTKVMLRDNVLDGGIRVDVFNADDEYHNQRNPGELAITGNEVTLRASEDETVLEKMWSYNALTGVYVRTVKELTLTVADNAVTFEGEYTDDDSMASWITWWGRDGVPTGIHLDAFKDTHATISDNVVRGTHFGVLAEDFDPDVTWRLADNVFEGVEEPTYWDDSVESQPQQE